MCDHVSLSLFSPLIICNGCIKVVSSSLTTHPWVQVQVLSVEGREGKGVQPYEKEAWGPEGREAPYNRAHAALPPSESHALGLLHLTHLPLLASTYMYVSMYSRSVIIETPVNLLFSS